MCEYCGSEMSRDSLRHHHKTKKCELMELRKLRELRELRNETGDYDGDE